MATLYWGGGTGTWNSATTTNWYSDFACTILAGVAPTSADTVIFDANSGTAATVTVTSTAVSLSTTINKADITLSLSGSPTLCTAAGLCTLTAGTLNLNNFVLSTGRFSSSNTNVRTITTGSGSFTVTGNSATVWNTGMSTNLTNTTTPTVNANYSGAVGSRTINTDATRPINLNVTAGTDTITNVAGSGFNNLDFTGFAGTLANVGRFIYGNLTLSTGMALTSGTLVTTFNGGVGIQTITSNTKTMDFPITFSGNGSAFRLEDALTSGATRTITLTEGTLNLNNFVLSTGIFNSSTVNFRTLAFDTGKIVITGNNAAVVNINIAEGFLYSGSGNIEATYSGSVGTRTFVIGEGGSQYAALKLKVTAGTDTVYIYQYWDDLDFTGFSGTYGNVGQKEFFGNLTLSSGMTLQAAAGQTIAFVATSGPKTITSAGKTIDYPVVFDGIGGTWACQDALTLGSTRALTFTNGTLNLAAGTTSTVGSFATSGTTMKYLGSTTPGTQATISDASGTDTVTYLTIQDSNAIGGATWSALSVTNVNAGNNTGWSFYPTILVTGVVGYGLIGAVNIWGLVNTAQTPNWQLINN